MEIIHLDISGKKYNIARRTFIKFENMENIAYKIDKYNYFIEYDVNIFDYLYRFLTTNKLYLSTASADTINYIRDAAIFFGISDIIYILDTSKFGAHEDINYTLQYVDKQNTNPAYYMNIINNYYNYLVKNHISDEFCGKKDMYNTVVYIDDDDYGDDSSKDNKYVKFYSKKISNFGYDYSNTLLYKFDIYITYDINNKTFNFCDVKYKFNLLQNDSILNINEFSNCQKFKPKHCGDNYLGFHYDVQYYDANDANIKQLTPLEIYMHQLIIDAKIEDPINCEYINIQNHLDVNNVCKKRYMPYFYIIYLLFDYNKSTKNNLFKTNNKTKEQSLNIIKHAIDRYFNFIPCNCNSCIILKNIFYNIDIESFIKFNKIFDDNTINKNVYSIMYFNPNFINEIQNYKPDKTCIVYNLYLGVKEIYIKYCLFIENIFNILNFYDKEYNGDKIEKININEMDKNESIIPFI